MCINYNIFLVYNNLSFIRNKTEVVPTQVGELTFDNFQNVNEHLLTGYLDFETTHTRHEILCHVCDELRERSFSKSF